MKRLVFQKSGILALAIATGLVLNWAAVYAEEEQVCGEYGTAVTFAQSPAEAAKQALREEKLVFVLHVSGNFEDSDFT
jgi:hypothetical protein